MEFFGESRALESSHFTESRRLVGNYSRARLRITCRCLSVFNYYRRRSRMTGISRAGCHPGGEARWWAKESGGREGRQGPPREYARCRAHTARCIRTVAHYYGMFVIRHRHISHPDAFDLAREVFSERSHTAYIYFNYLTGSSISSVSRRDNLGIVIQLLTIS